MLENPLKQKRLLTCYDSPIYPATYSIIKLYFMRVNLFKHCIPDTSTMNMGLPSQKYFDSNKRNMTLDMSW